MGDDLMNDPFIKKHLPIVKQKIKDAKKLLNMPICTYLSDSDFERFASVFDPDINEVFQEVRAKYDRFYIQEREYYKKSWLGRLTVTRNYSIYNRIGETSEVQIMNFYDEKTSLCTKVSKPVVMAYLYGLLANRPQNINP